MAKLRAHETVGFAEFTIERNPRKMPCTLSIEGPDDTVFTLIPAGTRLPASFSQVFTSAGSFEMSTYLHLVLGERVLASANHDLCVIRFDEGGFRMAGKAQFQLDVEVSGNGRMRVGARNLEKANGGKPKVLFDSQVVTKQVLAEISRVAQDAQEKDALIKERFDFMSSVRDKVNEMSGDLWAVSKRKLTWTEKREFKACRKRVYALIEPGPEGVSEEQLIELREIMDVALPQWEELMTQRAKQVMAQYEPRRKK